MNFLNDNELWPGLVINMSSRSMVGGLIRFALRRGFRELQSRYGELAGDVCPNHDAIVVEYKGALCVGEAAFPVATIRTLAEYNDWIESGEQFNLRILEPTGVSKESQKQAADYWVRKILGTLYDFKAIPYLGIKSLFGGITPVKDWEFAFYCTEGVAAAYAFGANVSVWGKEHPTPFTTLKRACQGVFRVIKRETNT